VLRSSTIRCTGIHVAPTGVFAVELSRRRQQVSLTRCAVIRMEPPLTMPGCLVEDQGRRRLVEALSVLRQGGMEAEKPFFAISDTASFIKRRFVLPKNEEATRQQLLWEADQLLEQDAQDYVIDTLITRQHGFFIAARRQILELYGVLCQQAQVGRPEFDMASFALCNALECSGGGGGVEIILQTTQQSARAVLLRDGAYVGEEDWSLDAMTTIDGLGRLCDVELTENETIDRLWLAGCGDDTVDQFEGFAEQVAELDPFVGLPVADSARQALESTKNRPRAYAIAAGLAFRGLAE
jgi:Tfp pilus assembly PilM family ATPase